MECKYCGTIIGASDRSCPNCGAPAFSFVRNKAEKLKDAVISGASVSKRSKRDAAESSFIRENSTVDYSSSNQNKNHIATRQIYIPMPPLSIGAKLAIGFFVVMILGFIINQ